jgi:dihydroxy-acid dehydratase
MVREDLKPSDILTRKAFENAIVVNSAIGGSTNCPIHLNAIARHIGVKLSNRRLGQDRLRRPAAGQHAAGRQVSGRGLLPRRRRAAVMGELMRQGHPSRGALTVNGKTIGENCRGAESADPDVIRPTTSRCWKTPASPCCRGNLFDSAIMKTQRDLRRVPRPLSESNPDEDAFEGRAIVFEGPEDYHHRIDDPALPIDEHCILFIRGTGPIGYPGAAEVVNMLPPAALMKQGVHALPCIGDGRQSGTSGSPSILNASPEAAVGGGLALLGPGDKVRGKRIDLARSASANIMIVPRHSH